jgi:hypothetical protein
MTNLEVEDPTLVPEEELKTRILKFFAEEEFVGNV